MGPAFKKRFRSRLKKQVGLYESFRRPLTSKGTHGDSIGPGRQTAARYRRGFDYDRPGEQLDGGVSRRRADLRPSRGDSQGRRALARRAPAEAKTSCKSESKRPWRKRQLERARGDVIRLSADGPEIVFQPPTIVPPQPTPIAVPVAIAPPAAASMSAPVRLARPVPIENPASIGKVVAVERTVPIAKPVLGVASRDGQLP